MRSRAFENWLRTEVADAYDELKARPVNGRTSEQVSAALKAETRRQLKTDGDEHD